MRAVKVGHLDPALARVRPVDLAAGRIDGQTVGGVQVVGDDLLDVGAVQIGAQDLFDHAVGPVDFA